MRRNFHLMRNQ